MFTRNQYGMLAQFNEAERLFEEREKNKVLQMFYFRKKFIFGAFGDYEFGVKCAKIKLPYRFNALSLIQI